MHTGLSHYFLKLTKPLDSKTTSILYPSLKSNALIPLFSLDYLCFFSGFLLPFAFRSRIHLGTCAAAIQLTYFTRFCLHGYLLIVFQWIDATCVWLLFFPSKLSWQGHGFLGNYGFWKEKYCAWWHGALFCHVQCNPQALPDQHHLMLDSSIYECTLIWRIISSFRLRMLREDM